MGYWGLAGPGFRAAADCARGANPVRADRPEGLRAADDCTLDDAFPVIGVDRDDLPLLGVLRPALLPLLLMVLTSVLALVFPCRPGGMTPTGWSSGGRLVDPAGVTAAAGAADRAQARRQRAVGWQAESGSVLGVAEFTATPCLLGPHRHHPSCSPPDAPVHARAPTPAVRQQP
ncbi:hypothetical protein ACG83_40660 [Frankia sp. R43]|nr:hypothetical protein ACG83_40660 [Frankia sp. R43]